MSFGSVKGKDMREVRGSVSVRNKLFLELMDEADRWYEDESLRSDMAFVSEKMYDDGENSFTESSRSEDNTRLLINDAVESPHLCKFLVGSKFRCDLEVHDEM